jgi:hypothetical protein
MASNLLHVAVLGGEMSVLSVTATAPSKKCNGVRLRHCGVTQSGMEKINLCMARTV